MAYLLSVQILASVSHHPCSNYGVLYCAFANIDSSPPASPRPLQRASFSGSSVPLLPLAPPTPRLGEAGALELALEVAWLGFVLGLGLGFGMS